MKNFSEKKLNIQEQNALRYGLNYAILPRQVQKDKIKVAVEQLVYKLKRNTDVSLNQEIKDDIKFLIKKFTDDANRACSSRVNQALHRNLVRLAQDPSIKICKFDKGNGVAIFSAKDYYDKLDKVILDKSKFEEINQDLSENHPIIQKEKSISHYIRKYFKKVTNYQELIPSGSQPGKLYGIAKVHKTNVPLRPVVPTVGTPEYKLAKYLDNLIKPHIPDTYLLRSTENFIERLKECPCNNKNTMVSFDVVSLFTNVPLKETVELVIERLYDNNNSNAIPFEKSVFRQLMFMATQGLFMYNDKLYKQIDGVTMGSHLGPTLANFFLGCLEEKILEHNCNVVPKLYLRYIDDSYALFDNKKDCFKFLDILNSQHNDIKFTIEQSTKANTLSFLDVQVKLLNDGYETKMFGANLPIPVYC